MLVAVASTLILIAPEVSTSATFSVLEAFPNASVTAFPSLVIDPSGNLFGFIEDSKSETFSLYELSPPVAGQTSWNFNKRITLSIDMIGGPYGPLLRDSDGALFTLLGGGGDQFKARVLRLTPAADGKTWVHDILYGWTPTSQSPETLYRAPNGNLFGVACSACDELAGPDVFFELSPGALGSSEWMYQTLYTFPDPEAGGYGGPEPGLYRTQSGVFFGEQPGNSYKPSALFALTPPGPGKTAWTEATVGTKVAYSPSGPLLRENTGAFLTVDHGVTLETWQTCPSVCGEVVRLIPPGSVHTTWTPQVLWRFTGASGTSYTPDAILLPGPKGSIYGSSSRGKCSDTTQLPNTCGAVYQLSPPVPGKTAWTYRVLHQFTGGADGYGVSGGTIVADNQGVLYGIGRGESKGGRSIFKISP
jgi:hypothetical protein